LQGKKERSEGYEEMKDNFLVLSTMEDNSVGEMKDELAESDSPSEKHIAEEIDSALEKINLEKDVLDLDQIEDDLKRNSVLHIKSNDSKVAAILKAINRKENSDLVNSSSRDSQEDKGFVSKADDSSRNFCIDDSSVTHSDYLLKLYDAYASSDEKSVCLVIEYMGGGSLMSIVNRKYPVDENNIAVMAYSVLQALNELSSHNMIHRDVKPQNILCQKDGTVKLADFGISRSISTDSSNPMTFLGSLSYMSPERIRGESYNSSCDIWSLGMCILSYINGVKPLYKSVGYWGMLDNLQKDPPNIQQRGSINLSPEVNEFLDMCLERDSLLRPNAANLLQSPFINNAILTKVINPSVPPILKPDFEALPNDFDLKSLINSILEWQPEHTDKMVFLAPHINLDHIIVEVSPSTQRFMQKGGIDKQNRKLFSRKAINHLAIELNVHPDKILEIIIANHINEPKHDTNRKQPVSRRLSNPLFPYKYSFNDKK
jgi:serine/threonine protein kinase